MPDIGLLQGAPLRRPIPIQVVSAALAMNASPPQPGTPVRPAAPAGEGPRLSAAAPPSIRNSDLLWLGLALLIIIGTGIGIRDPWPADEPRFAAVARDMTGMLYGLNAEISESDAFTVPDGSRP